MKNACELLQYVINQKDASITEKELQLRQFKEKLIQLLEQIRQLESNLIPRPHPLQEKGSGDS